MVKKNYTSEYKTVIYIDWAYLSVGLLLGWQQRI